MREKPPSYTVKMAGASGLSAAERSAAELRFRMALEFGVGGPDYVVPALQACLLARSLLGELPPHELADEAYEAEREVISLWENAEDKAIMTAFKPFKPFKHDMDDARFEITILASGRK